MRALTFAIQKGGQGKSSLSGNVSYLLSKQVKTLAIDGDPQGSLSSWLITESPKYEIADVLQGKASLRELGGYCQSICRRKGCNERII